MKQQEFKKHFLIIKEELTENFNDKIKDLISRYNSHLNSWKDSLRTYENGLNKTPRTDGKQAIYWKNEIRNAETKIETYNGIISDLKNLLN